MRKKREGKQRKKQGIYEKYIKRGLDIVSASLGLVVLSPIMIGMSVLIRIKLGKPVIFIQERPGKDERIFRMYKFRSMRVNTAENTGWSQNTDPRKTKFGSFIRKCSLDEFPQFFNVLKGDMSLIGPRPEIPFHVNHF